VALLALVNSFLDQMLVNILGYRLMEQRFSLLTLLLRQTPV
jgi:hypothetical protein